MSRYFHRKKIQTIMLHSYAYRKSGFYCYSLNYIRFPNTLTISCDDGYLFKNKKYLMGIKTADWTMIHFSKQILISYLKYLFSHQMPDMNGKRREKENGITHTLNINEF